MANVNITSAEAALKRFYLDAVKEQLDLKASPFMAAVEKTTSNVYGKDIKKVVHVGVNGGIAAGSETGDLPEANPNMYMELVTPLKNLYGKIELSDKVIRASANNVGAVTDLLNAEMEGLVKSAEFNFGRMLFGDGSGTLAKLTERVSSTDDSKGFKVDDARNIEAGMVVSVIISGAKAADKVVVTGVDKAQNIIFLQAGVTLPTTLTGATVKLYNTEEELTGLGAIFGTGKLYNQERSASTLLSPVIKDSVGTLTEEAMQTMIDEIEMNSGSKVNMIICSFDTRRAVKKALAKNNVLMPATVLEGGWTAVSYNGIPVVADRFCPKGYIYFLNTDDFELCQLCDWEWLQGEDGQILRQVPGKAVYTATLVKYADLICTRPCGQGLMKGVTEATK